MLKSMGMTLNGLWSYHSSAEAPHSGPIIWCVADILLSYSMKGILGSARTLTSHWTCLWNTSTECKEMSRDSGSQALEENDQGKQRTYLNLLALQAVLTIENMKRFMMQHTHTKKSFHKLSQSLPSAFVPNWYSAFFLECCVFPGDIMSDWVAEAFKFF